MKNFELEEKQIQEICDKIRTAENAAAENKSYVRPARSANTPNRNINNARSVDVDSPVIIA